MPQVTMTRVMAVKSATAARMASATHSGTGRSRLPPVSAEHLGEHRKVSPGQVPLQVLGGHAANSGASNT